MDIEVAMMVIEVEEVVIEVGEVVVVEEVAIEVGEVVMVMMVIEAEEVVRGGRGGDGYRADRYCFICGGSGHIRDECTEGSSGGYRGDRGRGGIIEYSLKRQRADDNDNVGPAKKRRKENATMDENDEVKGTIKYYYAWCAIGDVEPDLVKDFKDAMKTTTKPYDVHTIERPDIVVCCLIIGKVSGQQVVTAQEENVILLDANKLFARNKDTYINQKKIN